MQIRPRSGNAIKLGLTCLNTPGTIDSDYRGDIGIILYATDDVVIKHGDKIAQGVITKVEKPQLYKLNVISNTERGAGGFGHSDNVKE